MDWSFEHSVETPASVRQAWAFWTDVANWRLDVSVESVAIDGPFAAGSRGWTKTRGGDLIAWELEEVRENQSAIILIRMPGAEARFSWRFDPAPAGTRITQRASIQGDRVAEYAVGLAELEKGIPQGMQKLADEIANANPPQPQG